MAAPPRIVALVVLLVLCFAAAGLGGLATGSSVSTWFRTLNRPGFQPPDWVFGPVWTILFTLMAIAAWLAYRAQPRVFSPAMVLFGVQLVLNIAWSFLFFGLRKPGVAAVEILILFSAIAATTVAFWRVSTPAGALMIPYLAWVAFAAFLNITIWRLNP